MVEKLALGQVFRTVLLFSVVSRHVNSQTLHTHLVMARAV
jgi:hypothetical protein